MTILWLRRSVPGLSAQTQIRFHASLCEIYFENWHWGRFFSQYFGFPLSVLFHQCSIIVRIYKLFLAKEETEVAQQYSKGSVIFEIGGIGQKNTSLFTRPGLESVLVRLRPCYRVFRVHADDRPTGQLDRRSPWFNSVVK